VGAVRPDQEVRVGRLAVREVRPHATVEQFVAFERSAVADVDALQHDLAQRVPVDGQVPPGLIAVRFGRDEYLVDDVQVGIEEPHARAVLPPGSEDLLVQVGRQVLAHGEVAFGRDVDAEALAGMLHGLPLVEDGFDSCSPESLGEQWSGQAGTHDHDSHESRLSVCRRSVNAV